MGTQMVLAIEFENNSADGPKNFKT